jgi:bZIP transcription factor.
MPEMPAWAARLLLYIVVGAAVAFGLPAAAWLGKREVARWESRVDDLEEENEALRGELRGLRQEIKHLREQGGGEHDELAQKMDQILESVE